MVHGIIRSAVDLHRRLADIPAPFPGERIGMAHDLDRCHLFDADGISPAVERNLAATAGQSNVILIAIDVDDLAISTVLSRSLVGKDDVQYTAAVLDSLDSSRGGGGALARGIRALHG